MVGETPLELHRRLRLERAAWRLLRNNTAITNIAFDAGFETHEAFTRAFRESFSTSPSGFRRRKHPRIEIPARCGVHYAADGRIATFIPRDSGGRSMDVEIKEMPELRVGAVHHVGPYNTIPQAFEKLGSLAGPAGLTEKKGASLMGIYYDDPETTPQDRLRSDAAIVVPDDAKLPQGLEEQRIPAGRYAHTLHVGPYEQLGDVWARFMGEWLPSSGHRIRDGASLEIYQNTPLTAPKDQLRTDLYIPIK
jgi:AraC family transcriptional regulator